MLAAKSNKDEDSLTVDSSATTVKLPIDEDNISDITDSPVRKNKAAKATSKQIAKEKEKQRTSKRSESKKTVSERPSTIDKDVAPNEVVVYMSLRELSKACRERWESRNKESLTKSKYKEKFNLSQ